MHAASNGTSRFPFGLEWQSALMKLLLTNDGFATAASKFLRPEHFDHETIQWVYDLMQRQRAEYGSFPSILMLLESAQRLDPSIRTGYLSAIEQLRELAVPDEAWIKAGTIDFIRRNIFVRAMKDTRDLYNEGKVDEAYDFIRNQIDELYKTDFEPADESWFFDDFAKRQGERWQMQREGDAIGTGIPELDRVLDGGLHRGELGIWMAYPKIGKTSMLMFHGFIATRGHFRNVVHFVLEGDRRTVENRYDTAFTHALYSRVKRGEMEAREYATAYEEYRYLKRKLLIRGLTESWEYTVADIHLIMKERRRLEGWTPDLVIVDYADLLVGRKKNYSSEYASQGDAYKDLKTLTSRDNGYRIWTAAQARRPESKEWSTKPHLLSSKDISGLYDKVRVTDFLGSLNATSEEQRQNQLRVFAELYRDNEAGKVMTIEANFSTMTIGRVLSVAQVGQEQNGRQSIVKSPTPPSNIDPTALGYWQTRARI